MADKNSFGKVFKITTFGESHGKCVGVVIDGCPAGLALKEEDIQKELERRRPGQSGITTPRKESDLVQIMSGIFNGFTTGAPICALVWNKDVDSSFYENIRYTPRPGHADYTAFIKYGGFSDYRGGGRFSGRITVSFVIAGAIAKKVLREVLGVEILAYTVQIGDIKAKNKSIEEIKAEIDNNLVRCGDLEAAKKMVELIEKVKEEGDSVGGIIECSTLNVPPGLGEPVFDTVEGELAKVLFAIPGVKGVEFGAGFKASIMRGSEHNDQFYVAEDGSIRTFTNNSGGILGGITHGEPIVLRVVIKPTATIGKPQKTVDLKTKKTVEISGKGRHDPCIVPRAIPVIESAIAVALTDLATRMGLINRVITNKNR